MKENKKTTYNTTNDFSNENICEIIEMAINDVQDLYEKIHDMEKLTNFPQDAYISESEDSTIDYELENYFISLTNNSNRILIH